MTSTGLTAVKPGVELTPRWALSAHARRLLTLALAGLLIALITRRPEFAGLAGPAVLLLAPWRRDYPQRITAQVRLGAGRVFEGEELPDMHAAWKEATVIAGKTIQNIDGKLRPGHDWRLQVTDEFANTLYELQVTARKPK